MPNSTAIATILLAGVLAGPAQASTNTVVDAPTRGTTVRSRTCDLRHQ